MLGEPSLEAAPWPRGPVLGVSLIRVRPSGLGWHPGAGAQDPETRKGGLSDATAPQAPQTLLLLPRPEAALD